MHTVPKVHGIKVHVMLTSAHFGANYDFVRTIVDHSIMVPSIKSPERIRRIEEGGTPMGKICCQPTL